MNTQNNHRPRQYRGQLPRPDKHGNVRPRIGGRRFTVGNIRDASEGEMVRRLNALKDFFDAQCEELGIDRWANWCLPWAKKLAQGEKLIFNISPLSASNDSVGKGYATEDAFVLSRLRKLGLVIEANDSEAIARGERQLKNWIDTRITEAVSKAVNEVRSSSTAGLDTKLADKLKGSVPEDSSKIETRTFHKAIQAYRRHIENCLLYTSPSPRDLSTSRMPSSA